MSTFLTNHYCCRHPGYSGEHRLSEGVAGGGLQFEPDTEAAARLQPAPCPHRPRTKRHVPDVVAGRFRYANCPHVAGAQGELAQGVARLVGLAGEARTT